MDTVPVHLPSSSDEGPSMELPTSSMPEFTIAEERVEMDGMGDSMEEEGFMGSQGEGEEVGMEMPVRVELVEQEDVVDFTGGEKDEDPLQITASSAGTRKRRKVVTSPVEESDEDYFLNLRVVGRKKKVKEESKKGKERDIEELMDAGREEEEGWKERGREREKEGEEGKRKEEDVGVRRRTRAGRKAEERDKKDTPEEEQGPVEDHVGPVEYRGTSVAALGATALEWLTDLDEMRVRAGMKKGGGGENKEKGLQGGVSGLMKTKIRDLKNIARALTSRALVSGDVPFLRGKNEEMRKHLKEGEDLIKSKDRRIKDLEREVNEMKERMMEQERMIEDEEERRQERARLEGERRRDNTYLETKPVERKESRDTYHEYTYLNEEEVFVRPAIKGRSMVIAAPALQLKKKEEMYKEKVQREVEVNAQIKTLIELRKRIRLGQSGVEPRVGEDRIEKERIGKSQGKPRIIENIQLLPPRIQGKEDSSRIRKEEEWRKAEGKRKPSRVVSWGVDRKPEKGKGERNEGARSFRQEGQVVKGEPRRAFRTAAVAIRSLKGEELSYAEILSKAKEKVSLVDLGIERSKIRIAANGGRIIEIPGPDRCAKADSLANRLKEVLGEEAAISRPVAKSELRMSGFDDSISRDEIMFAIAERGECSTADVRVGQIRVMGNGLRTVWIQCPLGAAIKVEREGKMRIGWTTASLERLRTRPVQCHRCWKYGHLRNQCREEEDRRNRCYRCGKVGHQVRTCIEEPRCIVCESEGRRGDHRLGSMKCEVERFPNRIRSRMKEVPEERNRTDRNRDERRVEVKDMEVDYLPDRRLGAQRTDDEN